MNTLHDIRYAIAGSLAEFDLDLGLAPQALCLRPLSRAKSALASHYVELFGQSQLNQYANLLRLSEARKEEAKVSGNNRL